MIYFFYLSTRRRKIIHGGFFISFVFLFFYLFAWLVGWLARTGLDGWYGMVRYWKVHSGIRCLYLFIYLFIYSLSNLCVVSYLSYIYFILSIFSCTNYWWWWRWMVVSLIIYLSPTYHTKLTLALDNSRVGQNSVV